MNPLGTENTYSIVDGQLVNDRIMRIVAAIKDYEPDIDVQWQTHRAQLENNLPMFKIIYAPPGETPFILFHVRDEESFDERVLHRIIVNDQRNGTVTWSEYSAWEESQRLIEKQKSLDAAEQAADIAKHVFASKLNKYTVNSDLIIKDGIPFNAKGY